MDDGGVLGNCAVIKVVGIGGAGSNAVDRMIEAGVQGVEYVALNTDVQALARSVAPVRLHIGPDVTQGKGCGGDAKVGEKAVDESSDDISEILRGADMVFVTAGMGGGTGTGGAATVGNIARDLGALTVAVVTRPFAFEGSKRQRIALDGIERLSDAVDTLIVISNDRLLHVVAPDTTITGAFGAADNLLLQGIQGISELITTTGLINVDFNDVRAIMGNGGAALMAIGSGQGENRAVDAAVSAVSSELVDVSIDGAKGVLLNVKGGENMTLTEVSEAAELIREMVDPDANIIFGATIDDGLEDELQVTVIATGFAGQGSWSNRPEEAMSASFSPRDAQPKTISFPAQGVRRNGLDLPPELRQAVAANRPNPLLETQDGQPPDFLKGYVTG